MRLSMRERADGFYSLTAVVLDQVGVSGCAIDTSIPGVYRIVFRVTDSAGNTVTANRTLAVQAMCPLGEAPCADRTSCSVNGVCVDYLGTSSSIFENSLQVTAPSTAEVLVTGVDVW
eukprot:1193480-Prorocentrum_minimum.AAC.3